MKRLSIVWQRLTDSGGQTCDRCGATYQELQQAIAKLEKALQPLGIETTFETRELDREAFVEDPSQSNRVWIAGRPIEEWLGARVAASPCCSVCGDSECRTIEVGNDVFEAIPSELVLKAALIAASELVELSMRESSTEGESTCCPR